MLVGLLKEIKADEYRVALTPEGAKTLTQAGHQVIVETQAGAGSGFTDQEYLEAGATIQPDAKTVCSSAKLILKVKEPLPQEFAYFNPGHLLFTYFHFASNKPLTQAMLANKITCIAYETAQTPDNKFPLLSPMSEVAGSMAPLVAANLLAKPKGGLGILPARVTGTTPAKFLVLGSGVAGTSAATIAHAIGANVTIITLNAAKEASKFPPGVQVLESTPQAIAGHAAQADALIGAVYIAGSKAPVLVPEAVVKSMKKGSVIVDIAIDQGGCTAYSRPTTHTDPTFVKEGVIHYCVANMPGAYPHTSTLALTNATLPYALKLAEKGLEALKEDPALLKGLNCINGTLTNEGVAKAHGLPYTPPQQAI